MASIAPHGLARSRSAPRARCRAPARAFARGARARPARSPTSVSGPRTARRAGRPSAAPVRRALVGRDEERHVIVALLQVELELDAAEKGRQWMKDKPVDAGLDLG